MSKKTKIIILIILSFLLTLFLFELIIGCGSMKSTMDYSIKHGGNMFAIYAPIVEAGIYHFIFIIIIAFIAHFKNIDSTYKKILKYLPVYTIVLTLPMSLPAMLLASIFHLYGLG